MVKTLTWTLLLCCLTLTGWTQSIKNVSLLAHVPYTDICSDVEVYTAPGGVEYAVLGHEGGTSIISMANPTNPTLLFELPVASPIMWHEVAVYDHYAYITNEQGGGLRIIDLGNLPNNVAYKDTIMDGNATSHTLQVDNDRLYLYGSNPDYGARVYSLSDPWHPVSIGLYSQDYIHDAYVRNDTAYLGRIYNGLMDIVDFTNPANPVSLGSVVTPMAFTHNTWLNDAGNVCFTTDEVDGAWVAAYDISNPANITEIARYKSSLSQGQSIPHNVKVLNDFLVIAYYRDGVNIVDAARPHNLIEVGYYDTNPLSGAGFDGVWGLECFSPSGRIYAADMNEGFWVLDPNYQRGCYLEGEVTDVTNGSPIVNASVSILSTPHNDLSDNSGTYATGVADSGSYTVRYSKYGYQDTIINVVLDNGVLTIRNIALRPNPIVSMVVNVVEQGTNNPIPNAGVTFQEITSGIPTNYTANANGQVIDPNFMSSNYHLIAGKWGYVTSSIDTNITSNTNVITIAIPQGYYDDYTFDFGWQVNGNSNGGMWERGEPLGTPFYGIFCNPEEDVTDDHGNQCFVTGNQSTDPFDDDVDAGFTELVSPVMDLSGYTNPWLIFDYWFITVAGSGQPGFKDSLVVEIDNGSAKQRVWYLKDQQFPVWQRDTIQIASFIPFTSTTRVIIRCHDNLLDQIVEGAIDKFRIEDQSFTAEDPSHSPSYSLRAYPNPSNGQVSFAYDLQGIEGGQLRILNLEGREVATSALNGAKGVQTVNLSLPSGMYFAVLEAGGQRLATQKLVRY
ncbi:MAG: choice-of-anchor B family protein [Bacteroidia bacterium]